MSQFKAKLISGRTFTQMVPNKENPKDPTSITFKRGEEKVVTAEVKALLEKATDRVTINRGGDREDEERAKFEFTTVKGRPSATGDGA